MPRTFQPVPQVVELAVQGQRDGQMVENKYYVHVVETITTLIVEELATRMSAWITATMLPNVADNFSMSRVVATDLTVSPGIQVIDTSTAGQAGAITGDNKPNNVSLAIHRATGLGGKAAKSRIYWPCLADSQMGSVNQVDPGIGNGLVTALNTLKSDLETSGLGTYSYGFVSRILLGVKRTSGLFIAVTGHGLTDYIVDSMRARLPGHGL